MSSIEALRHATNWRTSTRSRPRGECVEIGSAAGVVGIRDTKDADGDPIAVNAATWGQFLTGIKTGRFDR